MSSVAEPVRHAVAPDFRALFDALPAAVYTTDADGVVTYFNPAAEQLSGRTPVIGKDQWCVSWRLFRPDGSPLPHDQCPMAIALKERRPVRDVSIVAERPDGSSAALMPFPTPIFDANGVLTGAINLIIDISVLKALEARSADRALEQASLYRFTDLLYRAADMASVYDAALDAIFAGLKCNRAAILLGGESGPMEFVASRGLSSEYRDAVAGHSPWAPGERDAAPIAIEDFEKTDQPEALKAAVRREGIRGLAFIPLIANQGVIGKFMVYHDRSHDFAAAEILHALTIARQLGFAIERQRAREYRADAEGVRHLLSAIVAGSDDAIIAKDLNGVIVSWNAGAERLFGYAPEEIIGRSVLMLIPPELQHEEPGIIERIRSGQRIEHYETTRRRKDGTNIAISLTVSPVRDEQGRIVGASKIARDVTERKRADEQRVLLVNELNHRVKNTLATVQSLAMQTLRNTERSESARAMLDARLSALSRAHDVLTGENWAGADLHDVVRRALEAFRAASTQVEVAGPHVRLTPKQALAISLALHELATNAAKYGALSSDTGVVRVEWGLLQGEEGPMLELTWVERGGPPVTPPTRQGFGSRLIERNLAHELGGTSTIEYPESGVRAKIVSPLELEASGRRGAW